MSISVVHAFFKKLIDWTRFSHIASGEVNVIYVRAGAICSPLFFSAGRRDNVYVTIFEIYRVITPVN